VCYLYCHVVPRIVFERLGSSVVHQGLWYALLPLVIRDLNAGRAVNVSSLVDEAWASAMAVTAQSDETDTDIL
jgi:hypothetical protein